MKDTTEIYSMPVEQRAILYRERLSQEIGWRQTLLSALKQMTDDADGCQCGSLGTQSAKAKRVRRARALIAKIEGATTIPSAQR